MADSNPRAYQVRSKTQQVVDYHYDEARPGKPLQLIIPGGIIALITLALEYYIAYAAFLNQAMDAATGVLLMLVIAPIFIGAVFLFSYGYELYDMPKALRLTAIIVFISLAAVVIVAVLFVLASGSSSKSRSARSSSSSSASGGSSLADSVGSFLGGGSAPTYRGGGPTFINLGGPLVTHTVTREVVHDAPKEIAKPQPFPCPNCGRPYMPSETNYACPNCGAPTPKGLFACRNCGTQYVPADNQFRCPTCLTPTPTDLGDSA
jgi:Zn finger protein HypA/HybF involved in hydrogenase expression